MAMANEKHKSSQVIYWSLKVFDKFTLEDTGTSF